MNDLLRLLRLFKPYWNWAALGMGLSFITLLANVGLMAVSGWFITAMAMAGVAGVSMNYFTPCGIDSAGSDCAHGGALRRTAGHARSYVSDVGGIAGVVLRAHRAAGSGGVGAISQR
ncbi:MAG: hypothetical protein QJT81_11055 [Candidatus Thiothrix putei]|uniref:Uncharacterized protein n=1 Tax=Candidatus Thiothrix putei TaxID=3080811 RepID=A0AA95H7T2_9GAMM|nr:MAG: hypothetical protein QJT81_11055 [Candidatus Thiothrix putei]